MRTSGSHPSEASDLLSCAKIEGKESRSLVASFPSQCSGQADPFSPFPLTLRVALTRFSRPRGCSSAGRALRSQCRGQGFDPPQLHRGRQKTGDGY